MYSREKFDGRHVPGEILRPVPSQRRPWPLRPQRRGVQQRDPLGTLFFLIALQGVVLEGIFSTRKTLYL